MLRRTAKRCTLSFFDLAAFPQLLVLDWYWHRAIIRAKWFQTSDIPATSVKLILLLPTRDIWCLRTWEKPAELQLAQPMISLTNHKIGEGLETWNQLAQWSCGVEKTVLALEARLLARVVRVNLLKCVTKSDESILSWLYTSIDIDEMSDQIWGVQKSPVLEFIIKSFFESN
jgi:hypothetical protein